jgi:L-lactate dehydrogenase complex protein LldG
MSGAREDILARVRAALRDVPPDEPADPEPPRDYQLRSPRSDEELADLFCERVAEYQATVRRVAAGDIAAAISDALATHDARRVAVPANLPADWLAAIGEPVADDPPLSPNELDALDGVLTGAALAIAETGTIVLDGGAEQGRRALSLVPDLHVCVVRAERIFGTVPEAIEALTPGAHEGRPLTFISGPSATSDIELRRVEGVHGPRRLEVVVAG